MTCSFQQRTYTMLNFAVSALFVCCATSQAAAQVEGASDDSLPLFSAPVMGGLELLSREEQSSPQTRLLPVPININDFFFFAQETDRAIPDVLVTKAQIKDWTAEEMTLVTASLRRIGDTYPGLIRHAALDGKVSLGRVDDRKGDPTLASASGGAIILRDSLLAADGQSMDETLVHELVHCCDEGLWLSFNPDWVKSSQGEISKLRVHYDLVERLRHIPRNPFGSYGCSSLQEALPEFFARRFVRKDSQSALSHDLRRIEQRLLNPSKADFEFGVHTRAARRALVQTEYDIAKAEFELARLIHPEAIAPWVHLAEHYRRLKKHQISMAYFRETLRLMEQQGIRDHNPHKKYVMRVLALYLRMVPDEDGAIQLFNRILKVEPSDEVASEFRSKIHFERRCYSLAAFDFFNANSDTKLLSFPVSDIDDYRELVEQYNLSVSSHSKRGSALLKRAALIEQVADKETSSQKRVRLYELAGRDYENSLKYADGSLVDGWFGHARTSASLKRLKSLVECRDTLLKLDGGTLPAEIVTIMILETQGRNSLAKLRFKKFVEEVYGSQPKARIKKRDITDLDYQS